MIIIGIIFHVTATARRRRMERASSATTVGGFAVRKGVEMSFRMGTQSAGVVNNVGRDQHITGGQQGTLVVTPEVQKRSRPFGPRSPPPTWTER